MAEYYKYSPKDTTTIREGQLESPVIPSDAVSPKDQIPESLIDNLDIGTLPDGRENIIIEKKMYGANALGNIIDRSFSEFIKKDKNINIPQFFKAYNDLFYDIPIDGIESHKQLIEQSTDYVGGYINVKDELIDSLQDRIPQLESQPAEVDFEIPEEEEEIIPPLPPEHPFYRNGSVLSRDGGGQYWYMDNAKRRKVVGGKPGVCWEGLKASLGHPASKEDKDVVVTVPRIILDELPRGPDFDVEDLTGAEDEKPSKIAIRLDMSEAQADPSLYDNIPDYLKALEEEINEAQNLETTLENKWNKYQNDKRFGYTEEDRAQAKALQIEVNIELEKSRDRLVRFKRIYDNIANGNIVTIKGLDDLYENLKDSTFSEDERRQFYGWQKGNFMDPDLDIGKFYLEMVQQEANDYYAFIDKLGIRTGRWLSSWALRNLKDNEKRQLDHQLDVLSKSKNVTPDMLSNTIKSRREKFEKQATRYNRLNYPF